MTVASLSGHRKTVRNIARHKLSFFIHSSPFYLAIVKAELQVSVQDGLVVLVTLIE